MTTRPLAVGDVVHGYCGGFLGRDHYGCSRLEALGADWAVARPLSLGSPEPVTATGTRFYDALLEARDSPCESCDED